MLFRRESANIDDSRYGARKAREATVVVRNQRYGWRTWLAFAGAILFLPFVGGCAGTLDTLTSQRFRHDPFKTMFHSDDPMWVLENVPEGDRRAEALLVVKEPKKRKGGNDEEQNKLMEIVAASATSDKHVKCRLSAIEALARFEDPRASKILVTAYHNAAVEAPNEVGASGIVQASRKVGQPFAPVSSFTPELVVVVQSRALEALGKKRTPEGLALLCEIADKPAKPEVKPAAAKLPDIDPFAQDGLGQDSADLRLAAIRALANFKNDMQAAQLLYRILTTEKEIAPRSRAYESLQRVTGKDYAWNSPDWKIALQIKESAAVSGNRSTNQPSLLSDERLNKAILSDERLNKAIGP